jgi:hypothetical protein
MSKGNNATSLGATPKKGSSGVANKTATRTGVKTQANSGKKSASGANSAASTTTNQTPNGGRAKSIGGTLGSYFGAAYACLKAAAGSKGAAALAKCAAGGYAGEKSFRDFGERIGAAIDKHAEKLAKDYNPGADPRYDPRQLREVMPLQSTGNQTLNNISSGGRAEGAGGVPAHRQGPKKRTEGASKGAGNTGLEN